MRPPFMTPPIYMPRAYISEVYGTFCIEISYNLIVLNYPKFPSVYDPSVFSNQDQVISK